VPLEEARHILLLSHVTMTDYTVSLYGAPQHSGDTTALCLSPFVCRAYQEVIQAQGTGKCCTSDGERCPYHVQFPYPSKRLPGPHSPQGDPETSVTPEEHPGSSGIQDQTQRRSLKWQGQGGLELPRQSCGRQGEHSASGFGGAPAGKVRETLPFHSAGCEC
jgi:hypothetical protein